MGFNRLVAVLSFGLWAGSTWAATIEQAHTIDGHYRWAMRVEGEIGPGDAGRLLTKLLDYYLVFGPVVDTVYLMSEGGDIEESMKMGAIIRRLRLKTVAPMLNMRPPASTGGILPDNEDDVICASACFLVFAGGVHRFGSFLALHRPYLPRETADKLSDIEYEAAQKQATVKVQDYLLNMEVAQFWIDKMMSTNSQESYVPTWSEVDRKDRHLLGTVPSIEEIILAKCNDNTADIERKIGALNSKGRPLTAEEQALLAQYFAESKIFFDCEDRVLDEIREAAFEREVTALMPQCINLTSQEAQILRTIQDKFNSKTSQLTAEEEANRTQLITKYVVFHGCKADAISTLRSTAFERESDDIKRMMSVDMKSHREAGDRQ
jgi:hypothetical protein